MTAVLGWMFEKGATPVLEESMRFAEARHRLILSNIANADTPNYRRLDLDKKRFQGLLADALRRREEVHPAKFEMREDIRVPMDDRGRFMPGRWLSFAKDEGPLRHDNSNVSQEREMALMAQNTGLHNRSARLLQKEYGLIRAAISGRTQG